jgi:hypothetical protein
MEFKGIKIGFIENTDAMDGFEKELQILMEAIGAADRKRRAMMGKERRKRSNEMANKK